MKSIITFLFVLLAFGVSAQNFNAMQQSQEKTIKAAYKRKKVTEIEYNKLMREQEIIKQTIYKYEADKQLDPHEKNCLLYTSFNKNKTDTLGCLFCLISF